MPITKIELVAKFDNPLLYRTEYVFRVYHEASGTPSRQEVKEKVCEILGVPKDRVVIREIKTEYGIERCLVEVFVYYDKEWLMKIEPKHVLIREGFLQPEKKGEGGG